MGFLDKINAAPAAASSAAAPKKVNPLLKKKMGDAPTKKEASAEDTSKKKVLPLKKKELPKKQEVKAKEEAKEKVTAPEVTPAEEVKVETPAEATKGKTAQVKTPAEEEAVDTPAETEAPAEEKVEEKAEEKKATQKADKKKSSAKSNNKKKAAPVKEEEEVEDTLTDIPTTAVSYNEAILSITSPFIDEDWDLFKKEVEDELNKIVISEDMNPGTLKVVISELSMLREKVWLSFQEQKTLYESLSSKEPEGLIERVKRVNLGKGNNDMERRKAGIRACMSYKTDAGDINLYEVLDETRTRYNFLRSVVDSIKYKTDILITLNGALKLEKDHL